MEEDAGKSGSSRAKMHLAMMRAAYVVETRRFDGDVARSLPGSERGIAIFAEGFAAAGRKDWERARKAADSIGKETAEPHHGGGSMYAMGQGVRSFGRRRHEEGARGSPRGVRADRSGVSLSRKRRPPPKTR